MNHSNNAFSVLNGSITSVATAITVATGTGARFPASNFMVTLIGYDGIGNENAWEICLCSSRSGDVLTVVRGRENTTAVAWANATRIENRLTAGTMGNLLYLDKGGTVTAPVTLMNGAYTALKVGLTGLVSVGGEAGSADSRFTITNGGAEGLEFSQTAIAGQNRILSYNRTGMAFVPLNFAASQHKFNVSGSDVLNVGSGGHLNFTGTAQRITGDFSNGTVANRLAFQTSTPNSNTTVFALPNGSATTSGFLASNTADPTHCSEASLLATTTDIRVSSATRGSGTFLPLTFYTNGLERMRVAVDGTTTFVSGAFGYGAGAGGTVTQTDSKSQAVVMATPKPSGLITMHGASLAAGASIEFGFTNSMLAATDGIVVRPDGFTGYAVEVAYFNSATEVILRVTNKGATRSDALVIVFQLVKGSVT